MEALRKTIEGITGIVDGKFIAGMLLPLLHQAEEEHEETRQMLLREIDGTVAMAAIILEREAQLTTLQAAVKEYLLVKSGWSAAYDSTQDVYDAYLEQIARAEKALRKVVE